jgi:hypothetical protein
LATVKGKPIHWNCAHPIEIVLAGAVPAGVEQALQSVVNDLKKASGLPLTVIRRVGDVKHSTINVHYAPLGTAVDNLSLNDADGLGVGGPTWNDDGVIGSGNVLIRNDAMATDPNSPQGRHVLMHEIGHALGLGHAADGTPQVMAPWSGSDAEPVLGDGDRAGLELIGCPR